MGHKWGPDTDVVGYESEAQMSGLSQRWRFGFTGLEVEFKTIGW